VSLRRSEPSLEDVFIHLMGGVADNFAAGAPAPLPSAGAAS
jgi:hypothetical protein